MSSHKKIENKSELPKEVSDSEVPSVNAPSSDKEAIPHDGVIKGSAVPATAPLSKKGAKKKGAKKKGAKKKTKSSKPEPLKGTRSTETLFRSSYQMLLALTGIADNKASIMMSLNGVIISVLVAFSAPIRSDHSLVIPWFLLLVSCAISAVFSVMAAFPRVRSQPVRLEDIQSEKKNLLFFVTMEQLSEKDFVSEMLVLTGDPEKAYRTMAANLHGIGRVLMRKFGKLRISYIAILFGFLSSVMWIGGLVLFGSVIEGVSLGLSDHPLQKSIPRVSSTVSQTPSVQVEYERFQRVFEPSGAQVLPDGRVLVVEDDGQRPFSLLQPIAGQKFVEEVVQYSGGKSDKFDVQDLEALAIDHGGFVYAVSSLSRNTRGHRDRHREKIMRFRVDQAGLRDYNEWLGLREAIIAQHPALAAAADVKSVKKDGGLNVEAMSFGADGEQLYLGLRGPLVENRAIIITVANIRDIFDSDAPPTIGPELILLDLDGHGLRGMDYVPRLDSFLLSGGPMGEKGNGDFTLWSWSGGAVIERVEMNRHPRLSEVEGVTPVVGPGWEGVLLVMDDGSRKKHSPAQWMVMPYDLFLSDSKTQR